MKIILIVAILVAIGTVLPPTDACCCSLLDACVGSKACNVFGCNCKTQCYKGKCGYCPRCSVDITEVNVGITA